MMCQATVYLNDKIILRDVLFVESVPEGIKLVALFEPVTIVPARICKIDLMKHKVILESLQKSDESDENSGETSAAETV